MSENQPKNLKPIDLSPVNTATKPSSDQPTQPISFSGIVIDGVFMAPRPQLSPIDQANLREKMESIEKHRN